MGIFYNEDVTGPITGWADFFAIPEKTGGKITFWTTCAKCWRSAIIVNGTSVNSADPAEVQAATDYVLAHKAGVSAFTYEDAADADLGRHCGGAFLCRRQRVLHRNARTSSTSSRPRAARCIRKTSACWPRRRTRTNAKKFMEFYLQPEIAALNVAQQFNGTANVPARMT